MTNEQSLPQLAEGWKWSTLGDVFWEMKNGTTVSQNKECRGIPVTRIETIQNARFDLKRIGHVDGASPDLIRAFQYCIGDIAFSHINSLEHVGKTALYEGVPEGLLHGMNLLRLRLGHDSLHPRFLHTAMQQSFFRDEVRNRVGRAVNQVSINQTNLSEVPLPIAPLAEQPRIVAKLDELFPHVNSAREHLSRVPAILKRFRQAVLAAACSGRLTEDWRSSRSQETTLVAKSGTVSGLFDEGDLPELPETWSWRTIGALASAEKNSITDGPFGSNLKTEHYTTSGPRVIRLQNIGDYRFVNVEAHVSNQHFHTLTKHQIRAGDVAIACLGDPVPRACLIPESVGPAIVKADCVRFKPNSEIANGNYVCYVLNDSSTRTRMSEIVHGVGRARLNLQQIKSIPVPLPPLAEQLELVRRVEAMLHLAASIERRVALAAGRNDSLTQSILAKAFRGEMVPTEAELARREGREYEPASVLLERIKAERESRTSVKPERKGTQPRKAKLAATKG